MPVKIHDGLPAVDILAQENVFVMTDKRAAMQDIRPLKILVLNLMPTKEATEAQLLRVLSNSPLQIEVTFLQTATYQPTHIDPLHINIFYNTFDEVRDKNWDGLIITGAPVEHLAFTEVEYWDELTSILDWAQKNVYSTLHICWAAQAGLFHYYGIDKRTLSSKVFGIFQHSVTDDKNKLTRGFDDVFNAPHSRHTTVLYQDIIDCEDLELLAYSDEAGAYLVASKDGRKVFVTGHAEYDGDTLKKEYERDKISGLDIDVPHNYFPYDDTTLKPQVTWRAHANLLFSNWVNYCVYQETPYDLDELDARKQISE